jgi:Fe-S cluster assembly iron-binding protein IscA
MLVLTPSAVAVVNNLTAASGRPKEAGLRISSDTTPQEGGLRVEVATHPAEQDQVHTETGARIFLDPDAESYLADKVLDASMDNTGGAHFVLGAQGADDDSSLG